MRSPGELSRPEALAKKGIPYPPRDESTSFVTQAGGVVKPTVRVARIMAPILVR
jgi:hypothetical protein